MLRYFTAIKGTPSVCCFKFKFKHGAATLSHRAYVLVACVGERGNECDMTHAAAVALIQRRF